MAERRGSKEFEKRFESEEVLRGLLELAGSEVSPETVEQRMKEAHARGESAAQVIPTLFDEEPRFPDPSIARRLYGNLFGLWELIAQGRSMPRPRPDRPKKERPEPPSPLEPGVEPDEAWVASALDYVRRVEGVGRTRLEHAFENREDALLVRLDEDGLSDEAYLVVRHTLFELFAVVELALPGGAGTAGRELLDPRQPALPTPATLSAAGRTALGEGEALQALGLVERALGAFWRGRKTKR